MEDTNYLHGVFILAAIEDQVFPEPSGNTQGADGFGIAVQEYANIRIGSDPFESLPQFRFELFCGDRVIGCQVSCDVPDIAVRNLGGRKAKRHSLREARAMPSWPRRLSLSFDNSPADDELSPSSIRRFIQSCATRFS